MSVESSVSPARTHVLPPAAQTVDPKGSAEGSLVVAWQHPATRLIAPVGLLQHGPGERYRFRYLRSATAVEGFTPFLSFPDWERDYVSARLFPLFSQRIMSSRRPDYWEFLRQLHLTDNASPWEQLARSEGRRTGDTVQVFPVPSVEPDGSTTCRFLVHGIRHVTGGQLPDLTPEEPLGLSDDPKNPVNPAAVHVIGPGDRPIGYVPDLLLEHLRAMQSAGSVRLFVEHVNGPDAPVHLRLLVRLEGSAPPSYQPMTGPRWATFV